MWVYDSSPVYFFEKEVEWKMYLKCMKEEKLVYKRGLQCFFFSSYLYIEMGFQRLNKLSFKSPEITRFKIYHISRDELHSWGSV